VTVRDPFHGRVRGVRMEMEPEQPNPLRWRARTRSSRRVSRATQRRSPS
jgi:hypothetical protein